MFAFFLFQFSQFFFKGAGGINESTRGTFLTVKLLDV